MRNYGGDTTDLMPSLYLRTLSNQASPVWDTSKWIPNVAVINLCTNDYAWGIPDRTTFTTAYSNFVKKIRAQNASAHIYYAVGPKLSGDSLASARDYISSVASSLNAAGDAKVHYIEFSTQDGSLGYGEDWHPSVAEDAVMGDALAAVLSDSIPTTGPTAVPATAPTTGPTTQPGTKGDVNGSGTVDIVDALLVAQYCVGLVSSFPC
jgi:hypothetical protein